ncbi:MAG: glycosyltransferase family 2 protein [Roseobacter sp.]
MTQATLLIPAHNEASVIDRTLLHLSRGLSWDTFRIVVIANGCSDATASRARSVLPQATVIETETPGKCNALNLGFQKADKDKPVICLDADIDVTAEALVALIEPLTNGTALAACGRMDVCTSGASLLVRAYYKGWATNPYFDRGKFGGLFALSPDAVARVFPLPHITADDEFIRRSFAPGETALVDNCRFGVRAPQTLASLARVRRRSLRGARQITTLGLASPERGSIGSVVRRAALNPKTVPDVAIYACVNAWVRFNLAVQPKHEGLTWERDLTTRGAG